MTEGAARTAYTRKARHPLRGGGVICPPPGLAQLGKPAWSHPADTLVSPKGYYFGVSTGVSTTKVPAGPHNGLAAAGRPTK